MSAMKSEDYDEGYWERGEGSNYVNYGYDGGWDPTLDVMLKFLPAGSRLYEVGAAKGWFLWAAQRRDYFVGGMDISQYAVDHQAPVGDGLIQGNAAVDKIPGRWDAVCSWEMLEHVPEDELDAVLANMEQAVIPGGWMFHRIGCDNGDGLNHNHDQDKTHQPEQTYDWWVDRLTDRGWLRQLDAEALFDRTFAERDWSGRFFVYRIPIRQEAGHVEG